MPLLKTITNVSIQSNGYIHFQLSVLLSKFEQEIEIQASSAYSKWE